MKRILFGLLLGVLMMPATFSGAKAAGDLIGCSDASVEEYNRIIDFLQKHPNDPLMLYSAGLNAICLKTTQDGMSYMQKASDLGHPQASYVIALYYETDGALDRSASLTHNQEYIDSMLYYYERTQNQIESVGSQYPEGTTEDMPYLERNNHTSAAVFIQQPELHYQLYGRALGEILDSSEKLEFTDSIEILTRMRESAETCLERQPLSAWQEKKIHVYNVMQVKCRAYRDFAQNALPLEAERIRVAKTCSAPLSECQQHQDIINQLIDFANVLSSDVNSISF